MTEQVNVGRFYKRLEKIYSAFIKQKAGAWSKANCISLNRGELKEDEPYIKSVVLHQYLFGYELPDTVLLLTEAGNCLVLSTKKKHDFLSPAVGKAPPGSKITDLTLLVRNKEDSNEANYARLLEEVNKCNKEEGQELKLGIYKKEWDKNTEGKNPLVAGWQKVIDSSDTLEIVDITAGMGLAMSVKDEVEQDFIKKSSVLSNKILKHGFIPRLEDIIDKEQKVTHDQISSEIDGILEDPSKINLKVPQEHVQSAYYPIVQSGGEYDLRVSAQPTDKALSYDIITISLGARYQLYCSNISRTFLVDAPIGVSDTYQLLLAVQESCIQAMVPGKPLKNVYGAAVKKLQYEKREDLIKCLPKNLGFSTGIDFRDGALVLSAKSSIIFRSGMVFNLSVGFSDVKLNEDDKAASNSKSAVKELDTFALSIADMVVIGVRKADVLTKHSKALEDISYTINEDDGSEDENLVPDRDEELARELAAQSENSNGKRTSKRLKSTYAVQESSANVAEREKRQIDLMKRRNEERIRENARARGRNSDGSGGVDKGEELETYGRTTAYPDLVLPNQVKVDMANKCILLPIGGNPVPFHISTVKAAVLQQAENVTYLRINFYTAGMALGREASMNMSKLVEKYAPYASFIRELTFRSLEPTNLTQGYRMICELRKRYRQAEVQTQEEATLVKQDKLIRTKNERVPRLSDLTMRPVFAGRKTHGNLDAHSNGLRFYSSRGETVDIIYSNIKHGIFQPCENEIMVLIHFHLKNPIMINRKKHSDIQVFTEVVDASQAVTAGRHSMYDPEEMDDEQRERQLRKRLNDAFKEYCRKVENVAKKNGFSLEFDIPYRDLGFLGNPNKEMVSVTPTLNCLVNLTETPFFVVDLSNVDHVHFERVTLQSKAFDMVIINKDFTKMPWNIVMIPNVEKNSIQDWLTDMEISYTEGPMNLNWKTIMSTVAQDDRFYMDTEEDGYTEKGPGWSFLRLTGEDSENEEDSAEEDSDFEDRAGGKESEEEESEESDFDEEDSEESDFDADDDLEEQGMDWEDMEKKALHEDKRKIRNPASNSYNERRPNKSNKRPSSGGGGGNRSRRRR